MPIDRMNQVVANPDGLGNTGEIVLVGPDYLMRSDARHKAETHSVTASFRNPEQGRWQSKQVDEALAGKSGKGVLEVDGTRKLAAWCPFDLFGKRWAMLATLDEKEATAGTEIMQARLGETLRDLGHKLRTVELFDGEPLPADLDGVDGIVAMGGPMNVDQADQHAWIDGECELIRSAHERGLPIVGICLGAQLIAKALGGEVGAMDMPEIAFDKIEAGFPGTIDPLHAGIPWEWNVLHLHGQEVKTLPEKGVPMYGSAACKTQSFKVGLRTYGFQYHFEWTRRQIDEILVDNAKWMAEHGIDVAPIKAALEQGYDLHRQLGDKLCHNLANLLFPIDKRLPDDGRPVENFRSIG